jgi:phage baseplate assembly protein W
MSGEHFAFPFRFVGGRPLTVSQDSDAEIEQGVRVLLLSQLGERVEAPGFGVEDQTFKRQLDEVEVRLAASEWDERVEIAIKETPDAANAMIRDLLVQVAERED